MSYSVGSLVKSRNREWIVLPESTDELLILRPLGGTEDEITGVYLPLENVESAQFELPNSNQLGDYRSCRLLREAVRLSFRSSAGPFRSFGRIAIEPRPYQLVPLLMALKQELIRLLIADDVGIGKTIEACLIARELLDRGEIKRTAVLCPPQLAEQWQQELKEKFHIESELVLPSTAGRLERNLGVNESLFDFYNHVVISMDFIKSEKRRNDFIRSCPEFVIIDEAHTCSFDTNTRSARHQRFQLVKNLSETDRHLVLVTATPHSGKEETFRSMLAFLQPEFTNYPEDLSGKQNESYRRNLAQYFVQRRRGDIKQYMDENTPFPDREEKEIHYNLTPEYKKLFQKVINYTKDIIRDKQKGTFHQRVRWWSALSLLRSLASSPAAAAQTLKNRSATLDTDSLEEADEIGRRSVLDQADPELTEDMDIAPGSVIDDEEESKQNKRLRELSREAEKLKGKYDSKVRNICNIIDDLLKEKFNPIVFCRFIPTAEYVCDELRSQLKTKKVEVISVTGNIPPAEREKRISELPTDRPRVLVCTDCLSEGINLQQYFNAVIHYDLAWNPTRHEQREGRVDRFLQPSKKVRVVTYYGIDNQIDGIVLDILINKHKKIRKATGVCVPVPTRTDDLIEAVFEGLLLRESPDEYLQQYFDGFDDKKEQIHSEWEKSAERDKQSRTMFAQETIKVDEVSKELIDMRSAIGSDHDLQHFVQLAVESCHGSVRKNGSISCNLKETPLPLRERVGLDEFKAVFQPPASNDELYLTRTHPIVENIATYITDRSLEPLEGQSFQRCGVTRTKSVDTRTTLLLIRFRFHIITKTQNEEKPLLAEECKLMAFRRSPSNAEWLDETDAESLLECMPDENTNPDVARDSIQKVIDGYETLNQYIETVAKQRGDELLDKHRRVRTESRIKGVQYRVEPHLPADILGIYVYLPV